jgi:signal transduction histidine kinase
MALHFELVTPARLVRSDDVHMVVVPGSEGPARLLATALVAVAFAPVRDRLQAVIGRRLYGDRRRPYAALTRLARDIQSPSSPEEVMSALVTSTAQAVASPYVAIERDDADATFGPVRVEWGVRPDDDTDLHCLNVTHGGRQLGRLVVARRGHEDFSPADLLLLTDLAMPIGAAVQAVDLSAELLRSRERLLLAIEEERRRLGRDLHDDLGPRLAVISMQVEAAHDLIAACPCPSGCPSCAGPTAEIGERGKRLTLGILKLLLGRRIAPAAAVLAARR